MADSFENHVGNAILRRAFAMENPQFRKPMPSCMDRFLREGLIN
jgi:hypothetical protein